MSSPDREDDTGPSAKKRKVQRACDYCRRKKSDGYQRADNRCSKCTSRRTDCTYVEPLYVRRSAPEFDIFLILFYVDKVEGRMQRLEQLLKKLSPGIDITKELDSTLSDNEGGSSASVGASTRSDTSTLRTGKPSTSTTLSPPIAASPSIPAVSDDLDPSDDESELQKNIVDGFNRLSIDPVTYRYHGKSSGLVFVRAAKHLKDQIEADMTTTTKAQSTEEPPRSVNKQYAPIPVKDAPPPFTEFPPEDLLGDLMNLYFREMNDYMPLLHEPTFKQCIKNGLQHHHGAFGGTLLLVCACGARFSDDSRVLLEGTHNTESAGWKWFETVERVYKSYMAPATVYDLQVRVLLVLYLQGTTVPHTSWTHIGIGVRMGVDIGAHRKKMYGAIPTIEEEMIRRAFWILAVLDWGSAYSMGRPASIHDEDMDLGLPLECDDEYWISSGGERAFQQPHGRPSKNCFFTSYIRLCQILAFAVRTVYSINKSKSALGHGDQQWEQRIVADLDSALNRWVDTVPGHLRWDPDREDTLFLKQSAVLLSHYYQFQIAVHRPFISTRRGSPLSFPSLIICTNAARSGVRVVSHLYQRTGDPSYKNLSSLFMYAVVLLLSVWGEKKSGRTVNAAQDVAYVKKCLEMIRACHRKCVTAASFPSRLIFNAPIVQDGDGR
ncbi:hypothetical protein DICSQDRAFT_65175 [Dichomitus squalens LYAD-421 SS1]|uniref:Xylanolytic transcriptional activator regulatory domain-containing protein n=1 Tax=Dichomitus squalens (strain LYAD-421) TaxID=732165 RepID=R7STE2_DICSQ|nr:uncharacterized protein DICSQDRAFT_65175 [Dichomitus squalens LYAD-421 SS1]EJF59336.1 hypothetical protein DICSQDRAFT_65175 [Dichomitus squalens LYAD-421 SS1]